MSDAATGAPELPRSIDAAAGIKADAATGAPELPTSIDAAAEITADAATGALELPLSIDAAAGIKADAARILAHEQFRHVQDVAPPFDASDEMSFYIRQLIQEIQDLGPVLQWTIVAVCLLLLAIIGYHVVTVVRRALSPDAGAPIPDIGQDEMGSPVPALELVRARDAASIHEFAVALRHLHRYLRLELDRRKIVTFQESWTNWEYLQALSRTTLPMEPLAAFTACCDRVFYGEGKGTQEDYLASLEALDRVLGAVPISSETAPGGP